MDDCFNKWKPFFPSVACSVSRCFKLHLEFCLSGCAQCLPFCLQFFLLIKFSSGNLCSSLSIQPLYAAGFLTFCVSVSSSLSRCSVTVCYTFQLVGFSVLNFIILLSFLRINVLLLSFILIKHHDRQLSSSDFTFYFQMISTKVFLKIIVKCS